MERVYELAIIGGGAAGLLAASYASQMNLSPHSVVLIEKMPRPGRKLNITGKGSCNLTNAKMWDEFSPHVHPNSQFLKSAFYNFSSADLIKYFENLGVELIKERGDRVFPKSKRAMDITDALVDSIKKSDVVDTFTRYSVCSVNKGNLNEIGLSEVNGLSDNEIVKPNCGVEVNNEKGKCEAEENSDKPNCLVKENDNEGDREIFILRNEEGESVIYAKKVLIATGGLSYPSTGSTGDGYTLAQSLGHTIVPCFPSLTALKPKGYGADRELFQFGKWLNGLQLKNISLALKVNGKVVQEEFGDVDFTNGGLEGPLGFRVSRKGVQALISHQKVAVVIDFKPALSEEKLRIRVEKEIANSNVSAKNNVLAKSSLSTKNNGSIKCEGELKRVLKALLPQQVILPLIRSDKNLSKLLLSGCRSEYIVKLLKNWELEIVDYVGYERSVVTAGGVSLNEISPKTMESRITKGLFFAGEVIDIDADTGGYNLQCAFSSAVLALLSALSNN